MFTRIKKMGILFAACIALLIASHSRADLVVTKGSTSIWSNIIGMATFTSGVAITPGAYQVGRDADSPNQLHFNAPTGAGFEFSINDVAEYTFTGTAANFQDNSITTTGGGSLTGTWSDLGTVTTVDINGGTIDGVTIGGAAAAAGTFTTVTASGAVTFTSATNVGWSVVVVANQACNTTCTNACLHGQDTDATNGPMVDCADAAADRCLCGGSN